VRNFHPIDLNDIKPSSKKRNGSKNLCSTRKQVAKPYIAILVTYGFARGMGGSSMHRPVLG
jgi:hypothetical protein